MFTLLLFLLACRVVSATCQNEDTAFHYEPNLGDLTKVIDPVGDALTVNAYDALGDPLSFSVFPDTGNPLTSQNPLTTLLDWNAGQELIYARLPNQTSVNNIWTNGLVTHTESRNPQNQLLSFMDFFYDTRGRFYKATDSAGIAAQYRYDKSSNLTQVWDGRGNITRFGFGPNDEPTWVRWPDNNQANAYYDAAGRLVRTVDERGIESLYGYIATRLESVQFPAYPAHNLAITWAGFGMPGTITDSTGATTFGYHAVDFCRRPVQGRRMLPAVIMTSKANPPQRNLRPLRLRVSSKAGGE